MVTGHAQLAFTGNADGSLTGTYTTSTSHTYARGTASDYPGIRAPDDPVNPKQGDVIRLVPVAPHHARSVYGSDSPRLFVGGNTNWCQDGLANASQYCGA